MKQNVLTIDGHKEIYLVGDTHYPRGNRNKFLSVIEEIENNKDAMMIGMGDYTESISHNDPRYNPEETMSIVQQTDKKLNMINEQWDMFEDDIQCIKDKIIGLHLGNHGGNIMRRYANNCLSSICKRLNVGYLGDGVTLHEIRYNDKVIKMQTRHGIGAGRMAGHAYNKIDEDSRIFADMDVVANGHTHKLGVNIMIAPMEVSNGDVKQKIQYHCATGSFLPNYLDGITTYGERYAYRPLPMGYVKVIINDGVITHVMPVPM